MYKRMTVIFLLAVTLPLALSTGSADASWLSEITGVDVDLNRGTVEVRPPNPAAIGPMLENLPRDVGTALLNPAAPYCATAIRFSRGQALNAGTQPIPPYIRGRLAPYFPQNILDKVRWNVSAGRIGLDTVLGQWLQREDAITLDDVVVFNSANRAATDYKLWAHELTHVMQYSNMGVEMFAFVYCGAWEQLEQPARENEDRIYDQIAAAAPLTYTYRIAPGAFDSQIPWETVNTIAQENIDPATCIVTTNNVFRNICPIGVSIEEITFADESVPDELSPWTITERCNERQTQCQFLPNETYVALRPQGMRISRVQSGAWLRHRF